MMKEQGDTVVPLNHSKLFFEGAHPVVETSAWTGEGMTACLRAIIEAYLNGQELKRKNK